MAFVANLFFLSFSVCVFFSSSSFFFASDDENRCQRKKFYREAQVDTKNIRRETLQTYWLMICYSFHWDCLFQYQCIRLNLLKWQGQEKEWMTKEKERKKTNVYGLYKEKCKRECIYRWANVWINISRRKRKNSNGHAPITVMREFVTRNRLFRASKKYSTTFCVGAAGFCILRLSLINVWCGFSPLFFRVKKVKYISDEKRYH